MGESEVERRQISIAQVINRKDKDVWLTRVSTDRSLCE